MLEKIENGWQLAKASASVLRADKELLMFPLLSGIALIIVSVSFAGPVFLLGGFTDSFGVISYAALFLYYLVQYFVIIFFNTALVGAAMIRLDGGNPTVWDGLGIAWKRIGPILGYSAIAATVGLVLRTARERAGFLGRMAIGIVGFAWSLATFLVVPVLVVKDLGPIEAVKESARVMKRTWGEQIAGNLGLGFVFVLAYLGLGLLAIPAFVLVVGMEQPALIFALIGLIAAIVLVLMTIQAALSGIYAAALYRFADTGRAGGPFEETQMRQAFLPKK